MIRRIKIEGFKSLQRVELELGSLNVFIGANASGKSNFFDALRVLQGIGYGFTLSEILDGKPKSASSEVWDPIRGGSARAAFANGTTADRIRFELDVDVGPNRKHLAKYVIAFAPSTGGLLEESLCLDGVDVYASADIENPLTQPYFEVYPKRMVRGPRPRIKFDRSRAVLGQFSRSEHCLEKHRELVQACSNALSNTQRIDPSPAILRDYSAAQSVNRMGERGENFAALVKTICATPASRDAYASWLRQLWPSEAIEDVAVLHGALGEPLFAIRERGKDQPAPVLSDGTLRFAAITAAFFQPDKPELLTIEELESGIHASRVRVLVELLRSQAKAGQVQVMATTHSPIVLAWLRDDEYDTTFYCDRDAGTAASTIRPLSKVPNFLRVLQKQPIGELFAEGWLEGAL
ncbi:MAG: ATP-binding protein [Planctomycetes bacterium]|nr:ATP-binding protein [Planctomycetota bacterium]